VAGISAMVMASATDDEGFVPVVHGPHVDRGCLVAPGRMLAGTVSHSISTVDYPVKSVAARACVAAQSITVIKKGSGGRVRRRLVPRSSHVF
jgi:hypothetical protein